MKNKKMRCPICAEKMNLENDIFLCQHCGYTLNANAKTPSYKITFDYESNHFPSLPKKPLWNPNIKPIRILVCFYLIASIIYGFLEVQKLNSSSEPTILDETYSTNTMTSSSPEKNQAIPKSAFFIKFAEQVFQKNISNIHPEELARITSIRIYRDENQMKTIDYTIDETQKGIVQFPVIPDYNYADLSCFTGLKSLILEDSSGMLRKGDCNGLIHLQELQAGKTPLELIDLLPAPENLQVLGIHNSFFLTSCEGIEYFKNLTKLSINGGNLKTLNGLEQLPALKELELLNSNQLEDFSILYQLSELESLSIESSSLKEIGFVEKMPHLNSLSIKDANLLQINALSSCADSLQRLSLLHIYKVEDYHVLDTLDQLTYLQIELPYNYPPLSFSHMEQLTELSLSRISDISTIATALHLQTLKLDSCNGEHLAALTALSELKYLELSNLSGYFITLEPLRQIPNLEKLILNDCRIYANIESVLTLPSLKELVITDCSIGFDFYNIPENNSLEILKIEDTILAEILPKEDAEYGQIKKENSYSLSDYSDTLKKFPNLTELTLRGNELDSIAFAADLKNLQKLDITNNYVTDLTPLAQLSALHTIICSNNPIVYTENVKANIIR